MVPVVREVCLIRVYKQNGQRRIIDLAFKFIGVKEGISIARRGTDAYGGLNIRMMTPESQEITYFTDDPDSNPRRAWSNLAGT